MNKALVTALTALIAVLPLCSQAADITLEVEGLDTSRAAGSSLMVGVFTERGTWLTKPAGGHQFPVVAAADGKMTIVLKGLPAGPVALSLFHDTNANGKLDMLPGGMPAERYGFSNNAVGNFGPPRFEDAVVTPVAGQPLQVRLR